MPQQCTKPVRDITDEINWADDEQWAVMAEWIADSEKQRRNLAKKRGLFLDRDLAPSEIASAIRFDNDLNAWESDRTVLIETLASAPATSLYALRVKALAVQACLGHSAGLGRFKNASEIRLPERRRHEIELAEGIVRDLLLATPQAA